MSAVLCSASDHLGIITLNPDDRLTAADASEGRLDFAEQRVPQWQGH